MPKAKIGGSNKRRRPAKVSKGERPSVSKKVGPRGRPPAAYGAQRVGDITDVRRPHR